MHIQTHGHIILYIFHTRGPADTCAYTHRYTSLHIHTCGPMSLAHMQVQRSRLTNPRARPESMVSSEIRAQGKEGRADIFSC